MNAMYYEERNYQASFDRQIQGSLNLEVVARELLIRAKRTKLTDVNKLDNKFQKKIRV